MTLGRTSNRQTKFSFDHVYENVVCPILDQLVDKRAANHSIALIDACKCGLAIHQLKSPSLLNFIEQAKLESSNIRSVFGIEKIPSDGGMRKILDMVDSVELTRLHRGVYDHIHQQGLTANYCYYRGYQTFAFDGVQVFSSSKVSCPACLTRQHRNGTVTHSHSLLSAALVCSGKREAFVVDNEPIVNTDGHTKNDCERGAIARLLTRFEQHYSERRIVGTFDALYACAPVVERIDKNPNWEYVMNVKPGSQKHLFRQFEQHDAQGLIQWTSKREKDGHYRLGFANGLELNASNRQIKTNMLWCEWTNKKGKKTTFTFISGFKLTVRNAVKIMRLGRSRWKVENEVFNTVKNQDYQLEHNYGHGQQHLCNNMALLMMLAFTLDQIQKAADILFQAVAKQFKTTIAIWDNLRAVFKLIEVHSMDDVLRHILTMYCVRRV